MTEPTGARAAASTSPGKLGGAHAAGAGTTTGEHGAYDPEATEPSQPAPGRHSGARQDAEQGDAGEGSVEAGHGNSPAAWSAVGLMLVGFVVWAIGMVTGPNWVLVWIGVAIVPISVALGWAMGRAGLGSIPH